MTLHGVKYRKGAESRLSSQEVRRHIQEILRSRGNFIPTCHAKERMKQREFTTQDIIHVLDTGKAGVGYWNPQDRNYEAKVSGWDLDGEELELSIAVDPKRLRLIVVTGKRLREEAKNEVPQMPEKNGSP